MIAQANAALAKLKPIRRDNNISLISLGSKMKLIRSLVISIFLYKPVNRGPRQHSKRKKNMQVLRTEGH